MEKRLNKCGRLFALARACFAISSLAVILIPYLQYADVKIKKALSSAVAIMFWAGMVFGAIFSWLSAVRSRKIRESAKEKGVNKDGKMPGVFCFQKKPLSIVLYVVIILGIILSLSDIFYNWISEFIMFPCIAVTIMAFVLHCQIDGRSYRAYVFLKEGKNDVN